ncbi:MAG: hypothetical protein HKN84_07505 [Gammaproteobacteria bacterium]|nr:hypothetical protein [Gammaproteobacteria bacterium]
MRWISDDEPDAAESPFPETWTLDVPCRLARRGEQLRIIIESSESTSKPDAALIKLLQRANRWRLRAEAEEGASMEVLAKEQGVTPSYFARIVRLAYLAPDIVEAIVDGKQPATLTATKLARVYDLPIEWPAQRHRLGFPSA